MAISVDARPAVLPLAGGRVGATVSVEPLLCGEVAAPPGFFDRRRGRLGRLRTMIVPRSRWIWLPVPAFLVHHPAAGAILIDTGFHPSVPVDPTRNLGPVAGRLQRVRVAPDQALETQLAARSLRPTEIRTVVMTHLHFDHASGISELAGATFIVDANEWRHACRDGLLHGYHRHHFDHALDWRSVSFDASEVDSFSSFGRTLDLFGDGSVRLLSTPGHTFGHMSVLLRLRERELLLTADAMYSVRSLTADLLPLFVEDEHLYRRSLGEIRRYVRQTPGSVVVSGHDPDSWPKLASRYE